MLAYNNKTVKKILITFLFLVSLSANADIGYCFKYKVRFELKDKTKVTGYYLFPTYDKFFKSITSYDTILYFMHNYSLNDSISIYKNIITVDSIRIDNNYYSIDFIPEKSVIKLNYYDIINSEIIECTPCCKYPKEYGADNTYIGCCTSVIEELSNVEIDELINEKPATSFVYRNCQYEDISLVVLSYNQDFNKDDLIRIIEREYCQKVINSSADYFEKYKEFKDYVKNNNIIVFRHCWW